MLTPLRSVRHHKFKKMISGKLFHKVTKLTTYHTLSYGKFGDLVKKFS